MAFSRSTSHCCRDNPSWIDLDIIMHVIKRKRLHEFAAKHPETRKALDRWYKSGKV